MPRFEKFKIDVAACESPVELQGLIDGFKAAAIIWCKTNGFENEVSQTGSQTDVSLLGMNKFFESEVGHEIL